MGCWLSFFQFNGETYLPDIPCHMAVQMEVLELSKSAGINKKAWEYHGNSIQRQWNFCVFARVLLRKKLHILRCEGEIPQVTNSQWPSLLGAAWEGGDSNVTVTVPHPCPSPFLFSWCGLSVPMMWGRCPGAAVVMSGYIRHHVRLHTAVNDELWKWRNISAEFWKKKKKTREFRARMLSSNWKMEVAHLRYLV